MRPGERERLERLEVVRWDGWDGWKVEGRWWHIR